nr:hypothetical protein [Micromonospora sp. 4G55]
MRGLVRDIRRPFAQPAVGADLELGETFEGGGEVAVERVVEAKYGDGGAGALEQRSDEGDVHRRRDAERFGPSVGADEQVLGRGRGDGAQLAGRGVVDEPVEAEQRRPAHERHTACSSSSGSPANS